MSYTPPKSAAELLQRYAAGERFFAGAELDGQTCDFRGVNLVRVDLSDSFIVADFRGANLRGANFAASNVKTCDFREADLTGACFANATIDATEFTGAIMDGADFTGASAQGYVLKSSELPDW
jgi:uncharacterized protein YjbI with pentapeptide repeats